MPSTCPAKPCVSRASGRAPEELTAVSKPKSPKGANADEHPSVSHGSEPKVSEDEHGNGKEGREYTLRFRTGEPPLNDG